MVLKKYENKELKELVIEKETGAKLTKFSFPNQGIVVEAISYAEAVKKMQSLISNK